MSDKNQRIKYILGVALTIAGTILLNKTVEVKKSTNTNIKNPYIKINYEPREE